MERELLQKILTNLNYINYECNSKIRNEIEELLAQPERDKVDFQTLNEMGLKRLQVSDNLVLQESAAKSPSVIFAECGHVLEIIKYKKLLEIRSFIDEILNYADTPSTRESLSEEKIGTHTPFHYHDAEQKAFAVGVRWAERQHGIGVDDE